MAHYWKEKTVESGDVIENTIYLHSTDRSPSEKEKKPPEEKYHENLNRRIRDVARLLNCNYTPRDYLVTLTYSKVGYAKLRANKPSKVSASAYVYKAAEKELLKLIERCRYHCSKLGVTFKCVYITSNIKFRTKNYARIHHHVVVNCEAMETLKNLWPHGRVLTENIYKEADHTGLARYMMEQVPYEKGRNNYGRTLNLEKPIVTEHVLLNPNKVLTPPEGATVLKTNRNYQRFTFRKI